MRRIFEEFGGVVALIMAIAWLGLLIWDTQIAGYVLLGGILLCLFAVRGQL